MYLRKFFRDLSITVIGGGTGLPVLLRGIKYLTKNITAVVTAADDGGSSGRLREDLGIIPIGDLRNCLIALATTEPLMEKLFQYRFGGTGQIAGHSMGNLLLAALTEIIGDVEIALKETSKVLAVRGRVLPSTKERINLVAKMTDGSIVQGESKIPLAGKKIESVYIEPADAKALKSVIDAIYTSNICILGPGSLYTSVLPNLLIKEVEKALKETEAPKVYICNVMTQPGETDGYTAKDHVKAIIDHVGDGCIDYVLVNVEEVADDLKEVYAKEGSEPVKVDIAEIEKLGVKVIKADLISETNLVRHDPLKLYQALISLIYELKVILENK
ncbi:YvcK family protein [Selenomonadales bacterium OttesenSCG-928-I06]|nr:YvcK family protein [Selenomonadales bacterium OttesenSCG-928-I06]